MSFFSGHRNGNGNGNRPLGIAVVGVGYWGPNIARNVDELEGAELRCICDVDARALRALARRYPSARMTTRFENVLAEPTIDAVVIATPVTTHFPLASAALESGRHVLVEKPLAASFEEAAGLVRIAERHGVVLMPGHTFLYSPPVVRIRELIHDGSLGDIHFVSMSRVNLGIHQKDVSVITDLGPHDFSILHYWLPAPPSHVSALSRDCVGSGNADVAFVNLEFPTGTIAHVELSWLAPSKLRRTTIVGSRQMVVYDDVSPEPVRIFDTGVAPPNPSNFGEYRLTYRTGDIVSPRIESLEPLLLQLADFVRAARTGRPPRSTAQLGLDVVGLIDAAHRSLEQSGAKVRVPAQTVPAGVGS